mmetsp:Transcript_6666/g.19984  ORF Transcript_6666/g.19984 Transcript_6666/m.19984 type:complete len:240 (+) Transcript_6666:578-1297(+)
MLRSFRLCARRPLPVGDAHQDDRRERARGARGVRHPVPRVALLQRLGRRVLWHLVPRLAARAGPLPRRRLHDRRGPLSPLGAVLQHAHLLVPRRDLLLRVPALGKQRRGRADARTVHAACDLWRRRRAAALGVLEGGRDPLRSRPQRLDAGGRGGGRGAAGARRGPRPARRAGGGSRAQAARPLRPRRSAELRAAQHAPDARLPRDGLAHGERAHALLPRLPAHLLLAHLPALPRVLRL